MKLALPDAQNFPTALSKRTRNHPVTRHIVIELTQPKFDSAFWRVGKFASGMAMPKTPVNEDGDLLTRKNEVWSTEYSRISPPASNSMLPKKRDHAKFRVPIPLASDSGHHGAARC